MAERNFDKSLKTVLFASSKKTEETKKRRIKTKKFKRKEEEIDESDDWKFDQCKTRTHHSVFVFKFFGGLES